MRLIYEKAMTSFQFALPDHLVKAVDSHAATLAAEGEQPNRSATIRAILRDWLEHHTPTTPGLPGE